MVQCVWPDEMRERIAGIGDLFRRKAHFSGKLDVELDKDEQEQKKIAELELITERLSDELAAAEDQLIEYVNAAGLEAGEGAEIIKYLPVKFSRIPLDSDVDRNLYLLEQNLLNQVDFIRTTRQAIDSAKSQIVEEYELLPPEDPAAVTVHVGILGEETHNKGKLPLLVTFKEGDRVLGKVVYKPRRAETDRAVLALFSDINRANDNVLLPVYKISRFGEGSLWEFIEGELVGLGSAPSERAPDQDQLRKMEAVTGASGISDLHGDNVMIRGASLVPIDMEVHDPGTATGLYGQVQVERPPLSGRERRVVDKFRHAQAEREARLVPIPTARFMQLLPEGAAGARKAADEVAKALIAKGFTLVHRGPLAIALAEDFARGDVPMFTKKGKAIHYGGDASGPAVAVDISW